MVFKRLPKLAETKLQAWGLCLPIWGRIACHGLKQCKMLSDLLDLHMQTQVARCNSLKLRKQWLGFKADTSDPCSTMNSSCRLCLFSTYEAHAISAMNSHQIPAAASLGSREHACCNPCTAEVCPMPLVSPQAHSSHTIYRLRLLIGFSAVSIILQSKLLKSRSVNWAPDLSCSFFNSC